MAQERALQDTNTTNMTFPINFYQKEKKKKKSNNVFITIFCDHFYLLTYNSQALFHLIKVARYAPTPAMSFKCLVDLAIGLVLP